MCLRITQNGVHSSRNEEDPKGCVTREEMRKNQPPLNVPLAEKRPGMKSSQGKNGLGVTVSHATTLPLLERRLKRQAWEDWIQQASLPSQSYQETIQLGFLLKNSQKYSPSWGARSLLFVCLLLFSPAFFLGGQGHACSNIPVGVRGKPREDSSLPQSCGTQVIEQEVATC